MQKANKRILPVLVSTVAIVALAMPPARAKDSKNKKSSHSSAKAAAEATGHIPTQRDVPKAGHHDEKPGPAWRTLVGTVKKIEGNVYTVEDYEATTSSFTWATVRNTSSQRRSGIPSVQRLHGAVSRISFSNPPLNPRTHPGRFDVHGEADPEQVGFFIFVPHYIVTDCAFSVHIL